MKAVHLTVRQLPLQHWRFGTVRGRKREQCRSAHLTSTKFVAVYVVPLPDSLAADVDASGTTLTANTEYTLAASLGGPRTFGRACRLNCR